MMMRYVLCQIVLFYALVLLFCLNYPSLSEPIPRPTINMNQLIVITIVDLSSSDITRDSLSLFRSIRLMGGSLNDAIILACIPIESNRSYVEHSSIVAEIMELGIKVEYFLAVEPPLPKTMNKFGAFALLDNYQFTYCLWLDADIMVVQDPAVFLPAHLLTGQVHCVPDIYSYMIRYPHLRSVSHLWNPELPTVEPLGDEGMQTPYGMCNTGVLYFDQKSLEILMREFNILVRSVPVINRDRFLDSLLFVVLFNKISVAVDFFPFEMNYMAFFEEEILDFTNTSDIVFAHFLSDTEMYCFRPKNVSVGACKCIYGNTRCPPNSLILKKFQVFFADDNCQVLIGSYLPSIPTNSLPRLHPSERDNFPQLSFGTVYYADPAPVVQTSDVESDDAFEESDDVEDYREESEGLTSVHQSTVQTPTAEYQSLFCRQLWPPTKGFYELRVSTFADPVEFDILMYCGNINVPTDPQATANLLSALHYSLSVTVTLDTNNTDCPTECKATSIYQDYISRSGVVAVKFDKKLQCAEQCDATSTHNISIAINLSVIAPENSLASSSAGHLTISSRLGSGSYVYNVNPLSGRKPILLASQLDLLLMINDRRLMGRGAVICCDTLKGLETTIRIIRFWQKGFLNVLLTPKLVELANNSSSSGSDELGSSFSNVVKDIRSACESRTAGERQDELGVHKVFPPMETVHCIISWLAPQGQIRWDADNSVSTISEFQISKSFRDQSLRFVYIDQYVSYHHYFNQIDEWYNKVRRGGILMGSRFVDAVVQSTSTKNPEVVYFGAKTAVLSNRWLGGVLATYDEYNTKECYEAMRVDHEELNAAPGRVNQPRFMHEAILSACSPAWYTIRDK